MLTPSVKLRFILALSSVAFFVTLYVCKSFLLFRLLILVFCPPFYLLSCHNNVRQSALKTSDKIPHFMAFKLTQLWICDIHIFCILFNS